MKNARYLSWLFLVCVTVVVWNTRLHAAIHCGQDSCTGCSGCIKTFYCSWNINQSGSPAACTNAGDTCNSFCSSYGGVSTRPGDNFCDNTQGSYGYCTCTDVITCPLESCDCQGSQSCCMSSYCSGTWMDGYCDTGSPIMINLAGNGSDHLTSVQNGVLFDLNARGVRDRVSWTRAGVPVGFLVLDRNGNGVVDDGRELLGTATLKRDGTRAANGFEALFDLDGGDGVSDWLIDGRDPLYEQLRLWIDWNHNGISEPAELLTLRQAGVVSLFLSYTEHRYRDRFGNWYRFESHATLREHGHDVTRRVFDIFLKLAPAQPQS
jgi:hypothetical protein